MSIHVDRKKAPRGHQWLKATLWILCISTLLGASPASGGIVSKKAEPILSAAEIDYPPFSIVDESGRATGFSVELLRKALHSMERQVTFRTGPWPEVKSWLADGVIEVLPLVGRTPEREPFFDFTFPYMSLHGAIVVRSDTTDIQDLNDLKGRRVAVMKSDNAEEFLRREDCGFQIHTTDTFEEALRQLSQGLHDAVVIQRLVALRLIQEMDLKNVRVLGKPIEGFRQDFCFAVQKGDSATLALLNEGLALTMADGTFRQLHAKWFAALELPANRRIVVGGDHNYPPYEYLDEKGNPTGFAVELTRAIAREMGLDVEIRLGPWAEMVEALKKGEIDVIQGMFYSPQRASKFDFTQPHTLNHYVSVMRKGEGQPPSSVDGLTHKRIVLQRGDIMHDVLAREGLEEQITLVETQEDMLRELAEGKHDCAVALRISALYFIDKFSWTNLNLGHHPIVPPMEYSYAFLKGHKALLASFSEGLKVLQKSGEYRTLHDKWLGVYESEPLSLLKALRYSAMVVIPLSLAVFAFFVWTWSLRKQVTKRTRELRGSERLLASILEAIAAPVFYKNDQGVYMGCNRAFCELLGLPKDSIIGRTVYEVAPPGEAQKYHQMDLALLKDGGIQIFEDSMVNTHGCQHHVVFHKAIFQDPEGTFRGIVGAILDMTGQKRAEKALQQKQIMLERTESIAHIGSWQWTVNQDTITWSDELFRIFQRDPARWTPTMKEIPHIIHWEDILPWREAVNRAVAEGTSYEVELRALRPDGTVRHGFTRGYAEQGTDGKVISLYGTYQDITEYKLTQERIQHLNNVLRAIRDVNQLIVRERNRDTLILEACRLLVGNRGYVSSLILLTDANDALLSWAQAGLEQASEPLEAMLEKGNLPPCCPRAKATQGVVLVNDRETVCQTCPVATFCPDTSSLALRMEHGDSAFGYLVVALEKGLGVDIEEQKLMEEMAEDIAYALHNLQMNEAREKIQKEHESLQKQMIQTQRLEAVGRLAGGVAHDFNNMLGVIMGYAELAMDGLDSRNAVHGTLKEILSAAHRSSEITRQLLAFARKQTISPRVLDLNETVESMLKMLRRLIGEDIDLQWTPRAKLWPVKIDPAQVDQILANLCVNARDAITGVGKITISTNNVIVNKTIRNSHSELLPGDFVQLTVSDSGCGMDKETLESIFEPFFTTKGVGKGTGLGLATVYGIVQQNGGSIHVWSEEGKGTTVKVYLPRHAGEWEASGIGTEGKIPLSRGETVLLVEDEPAILKMNKTMLERLNYQVVAATTPDEAMQAAREKGRTIDLLITDVVMPRMNGRELAQRLHSIRPQLKILFMSGYTADIIAHHGVLEEGVHFIQKPFPVKDLACKIRSVLEQA